MATSSAFLEQCTHVRVTLSAVAIERRVLNLMNALYRDVAKNESGKPAKWIYDFGVVLRGIDEAGVCG
jgi:hypothetical protein